MSTYEKAMVVVRLSLAIVLSLYVYFYHTMGTNGHACYRNGTCDAPNECRNGSCTLVIQIELEKEDGR